MDKKKFKIILAALAFSFAVMIPVSYSAGANSQQPSAAGSREDPLVTLSFVEKYVAEFLAPQSNIQPAATAGTESFEIVTLNWNQRIRAKSGTLDLIVRPGSRARVTAPGNENVGIADVTSGRELLGGDIVPVNHLLVIPRADRRGLVILSDTATILVRGDYEIE